MLKKWNFKKYQTEEDWALIGYKVQKRKRERKESEVWWNGDHIPAKTLRKELNRYASSTSKIPQSMLSSHLVNEATSNKTDGLSPTLPTGVLIRSPPPRGEAPEINDVDFPQLFVAQDDIVATDRSSMLIFENAADAWISSPNVSLSISWDLSSLPLFELFSQMECMDPPFSFTCHSPEQSQNLI